MGEPIARSRSGTRAGAAARAANWREIERLLLVRIANRTYPPGSRIPTCQELAVEYGANKNTVHRAYRSLVDRGYLRSVAGMGTFVTRKPLRIDTEGNLAEVRELVTLAADEAKRAGLDADQFEALVHEVVRDGFRSAAPRIGFVECNKGDAARLSREMQSALNVPVQPLLISEVLGDPIAHLRAFDLLVVNLSHLATLESGLRPFMAGRETKIFPLHIGIDPEALTQIARLPERMRVGVICDLEQTLSMLSGTVLGLNAHLSIAGALTGTPKKVAKLINESDVLLATPSALAHLDPGKLRIPVIALEFQANERTMLDLAQQIARFRVDASRPARAGTPAREPPPRTSPAIPRTAKSRARSRQGDKA